MKTIVKKWGNSAAVRIPASVMEAMHLDLDEVVEVREEKAGLSSNRYGKRRTCWPICSEESLRRTGMKRLIPGLRKAKRPGDGKAVRA